MDLETIKRINRDALRAAQESEASVEKVDNRQMMVHAAAVLVAVAAYYAMRRYQPQVVMRTFDGKAVFDQIRAVVASVIVGLCILLAYHLYKME